MIGSEIHLSSRTMWLQQAQETFPQDLGSYYQKMRCVTEAYINIDINVVHFYVDSTQLCSQIRLLLA